MPLLPAALWAILLGPVHDPATLSRLIRATVYVRAGDRAAGTGWVADTDRRWIVTARHVVRDAGAIDVFFLDSRGGRPGTDRAHYATGRSALEKRGTTARARVIATRDDADLALLVVDRIPADVPSLPVAHQPSAPGEPCRTVGHRHDADLLWGMSAGHVRQVGTLSDGYHAAGNRVGAGTAVLLVQLPVEAGESGAPVVNRIGEVVGTVSAVSGRTPGLAIVIAASETDVLLAQARKGSLPELSRVATPPRPAAALLRSTVWVRPQSTEGRAAGVLIDRDRRLVLTSASAVGPEDLIDVVAPKWVGDRLVAELAAYRDLLGLRLSGHCVRGFVVARDPSRDLAVIELHAVPPTLAAVSRRATGPAMGDRVAAMTHPMSEELAWVYAAGTVRTVGAVVLERTAATDAVRRRAALVQVPHQGSSSGGPVVDESGELVGVLAAKEGARQELAYAATADGIAEFLTAARLVWRPESAAEWHQRALFLNGRSDVETVVAAHARAAALAPDDTVIRAGYARALVRAGRPDEAREVIGGVERVRDRPPQANAILAEAHRLLGAEDDARRLADLALQTGPRLPTALVTRAGLRSGADAFKDLDEAIFLDPSCAPAYRSRAALHDRQRAEGRTRAMADLSRAIELAPLEAGYRLLRAQWFEDERDFKKGVKDYARLAELSPLSVAFRRALANAQLSAGDESDGVESLVALARLETGVAELFRLIHRHGERLAAQEHGNWVPRVKDWYGRALGAVRPVVAGARQAEIDRLRSALDGAGADELAEIGERLKVWGQGPKDRPRDGR